MPGFVLLLAYLLSTVVVPARAQAWSGDLKTPEGWALAQIRAGKIADFNRRPECRGKMFDPHDVASTDHKCRQISPQFLADVLTVTKWVKQVPSQGVRVSGAYIRGSINLDNAEIAPALSIDASYIDGFLSLGDAHLKGTFSLNGSVLKFALYASGMRSERMVRLDDSTFRGAVQFFDAKIDDIVTMSSSLFLRDLGLSHARIKGSLGIGSSSFANVEAENLNVEGNLVMSDGVFAGDLNLIKARIGGDLVMRSSSFARFAKVTLNGTKITNGLFMDDHARFPGDVDLVTVSIGNDLTMMYSLFAKVNASAITVSGNIYMKNARFHERC